ncbi:hypothetical protein [Succinatimonas hippei]|uniref:SDH family Clp fold serine proteinase n=1 Tax=Succinatimonas hippei TaxID=626938 RepID=UPI0026EDBF8D|nr:hypothetical protein [Succinatimonas hippei]
MEIYDAFKQLGTLRNSVVIVFTTCDKGVHYPIGHEHYPCFVRQLIEISKHYPNKKIPKISLILNTLGGNLPAARSIALLIKEFSEKFEVIIPHYAFSAGTLISLYADNIIMLEGASLGPIDPSVSDFKYPNMPANSAAQLEAELIKSSINPEIKVTSLETMTSFYDPVIIGQTIRAQKQIAKFIEEAISSKINQIQFKNAINFLTRDTVFHKQKISIKEINEKISIKAKDAKNDEKILISEIFNYAQKKMNIIDNSFFEKTEYKNCMIQVESKRFIISSIEGGTDFLSHVITLTYNTNYNEKKPLSEENPKFIKNPTHEWYEQKFEKFL